MNFRLRDYQQLAVAGINEQWAQCASTLVVMATGLGKTAVAAHVIAGQTGRAMFLAHREELIWQARNTIGAVTGIEPGIEMADYRTSAGFWGKPRVVVSSVQTQYSGQDGAGRMSLFDPNDFSLLVVDECHHYVSPAYRKVVDHYRQNPNLKVLGITATPDRADEAALGQIFESVAFQFDVLEGIKGGWLVPIEQQSVTVDGLDLSNCRTTAGDLNALDLAQIMEYERNLHEVAGPTIELAGDRKTLVFCASVAHAERLSEIINRHRPASARWVSGETPKDARRQLFADYAASKFQFLCNCGIATEGFDDPGVSVVVMARPTKSRCLYTQSIGRATRPLPGIVDQYDDAGDRRMAIAESAKPAMLVVDLVGNAGRHKLISTADVLGGRYDDATVARAQKKAEDAGKPIDMLAALEESLAELHREREAEKAREAARRARLTARTSYTAKQIDPFDVLAIEPHRTMGWDAGRQLSEKQRDMLERHYDIDPDTISYTQGKQLIDELFRRWATDECSYRQARLLKKYGLKTDVTRDQAKEWIDRIASNDWKLPADLEAHTTPIEVF